MDIEKHNWIHLDFNNLCLYNIFCPFLFCGIILFLLQVYIQITKFVKQCEVSYLCLLFVFVLYSEIPELDPKMYGLSLTSSQLHSLEGIVSCGQTTASTEEVIKELENLYCGPISVEFQHISVGIPLDYNMSPVKTLITNLFCLTYF